MRSLKQELERTRDALKLATKRCRDLVRQLEDQRAGDDVERSLRDQQLSRILRALLVVEGRLKQEQNSIRQLLCEKDNVIRNQQLEIAKLRRYTKNYIKCKRDNTPCSDLLDTDESGEVTSNDLHSISSKSDVSRSDSSLSKDIRTLKCEIITKLNEDSNHQDHGIRKAHSFAESDVSKTSITSSEITDSTPSILSTEGFCEGESTDDLSPGSTLNKSTRCNANVRPDDEFLSSDNELNSEEPKRRNIIIVRDKLSARTDSNDDGMDCHFLSDEEPVYENSQYFEEEQVLLISNRSAELTRNNLDKSERVDSSAINEQNLEENSGNWYSDPDEDKASDEVFRHRAYQPNSKHNSVLECVNQILLRDMEEEENVLSVPRRFKHRGRIVRFQPARLSDIESVGSEMERRNSEEHVVERIDTPDKDVRLKVVHQREESTIEEVIAPSSTEFEGSKAIPLGIIEPNEEPETRQTGAEMPVVLVIPQKVKSAGGIGSEVTKTLNPTLKMERMEEKTCLQMSTKGLTIAKNLDYEDIESIPEITTPTLPKTPPALPPKPQYKNNTLILKKIPSPSFLINESHSKSGGGGGGDSGKELPDKKFFNFSKTPKIGSVRSLSYDDKSSLSSSTRINDEFQNGFNMKNKFNSLRSSFQTKQNLNILYDVGSGRNMPKVTNIVKHFEEFKIGEAEDRTLAKDKEKSRMDYDQDDIRQNFEEFNLDECDLFDDPDRPEADGSERLNDLIIATQIENTSKVKESNGGYDHFLEATGLSTKSILTPSRLLSNHKSMLKPKDVKYKSKIKATAVTERHGIAGMSTSQTRVKHWTGPFV